MTHRVKGTVRMLRAAFKGLICVAAVFWAAVAQAGCVQLVDAMTLANEGFEAGQSPDGQRLADLNNLIADMDNEAILNILRNAGRGGDFGELRNFLTQLKFMSQQMNPADIALSERFFADLSVSNRIVRSACMLPDGSIKSAAVAEAKNGAKRTTGIGTAIRNHLKPLSSAQIEYLNKSYDIALLSKFLVGFLVLTGTLVALHFGIIIVRIIYRGRRICDVAASLMFMGSKVPGRVAIIGSRGCTFSIGSDTEDFDTALLTQGTYCQIQFIDSVVNARVLREGDVDLGIGFQKRLSRADLNALLAHSDRRPRYDLSLLRDAQRRRAVFGM